jgi:hypothetical protein
MTCIWCVLRSAQGQGLSAGTLMQCFECCCNVILGSHPFSHLVRIQNTTESLMNGIDHGFQESALESIELRSHALGTDRLEMAEAMQVIPSPIWLHCQVSSHLTQVHAGSITNSCMNSSIPRVHQIGKKCITSWN